MNLSYAQTFHVIDGVKIMLDWLCEIHWRHAYTEFRRTDLILVDFVTSAVKSSVNMRSCVCSGAIPRMVGVETKMTQFN